jgi:hypothetical protein
MRITVRSAISVSTFKRGNRFGENGMGKQEVFTDLLIQVCITSYECS